MFHTHVFKSLLFFKFSFSRHWQTVQVHHLPERVSFQSRSQKPHETTRRRNVHLQLLSDGIRGEGWIEGTSFRGVQGTYCWLDRQCGDYHDQELLLLAALNSLANQKVESSIWLEFYILDWHSEGVTLRPLKHSIERLFLYDFWMLLECFQI